MRLVPHRADPFPDPVEDEGHIRAPSLAHDMASRRQHAPVASRVNEDWRRRHWRHLGTFIDLARGESLLQNSLFIMATSLVTSAFGYVFWLAAARLYSAPVVGLTAAITSASMIMVLVSTFGVGGTLIQSLPGRFKETGWSTTFWAGMATAAIFAVTLCGIALVVLPLISPELIVLRSVEYAALFAIATVTVTAATTLDCVYLAERRAGDLFTRNSAAAAVKVLMLGLLGFAAGSDALPLLGAWGVASVFGLGLGSALLIRYRRVARPPGFSVLLRTALGFRSRVTGHQVIGMGAGLLPYLLPVLVTVRLSASDNAYFFTTWMLAGLFLVVSPAVSQSLFAEGMHRPDEVDAMARSAMKIIGAILVPGLFAILAVGGTLLSAFGPAYADHAVGLLRITVLASVPDAVTNVYVGVLRVQGRLTSAAILNLGMGLGILVMSWLLLPVIGVSAVGYAFLAMQLCGCVYVVFDWRKHMSPKPLQSGRHQKEAL
jgi:O-antigen/teichoic acid export membrane protein